MKLAETQAEAEGAQAEVRRLVSEVRVKKEPGTQPTQPAQPAAVKDVRLCM